MNKKHLQRQVDSLARQLETIQRREADRRAREDDAFRTAVADLAQGDVMIITAGGHRLRAVILQIKRDIDMIDVSRGPGWSEFVPGLEDIQVQLSPQPGLV